MIDMVAWLLGQIAEDERCARAAVGTAAFQKQTGRWSFEHVSHSYGLIPLVFAIADEGAKTQVALLEQAWEPEQRGEHIARHDPARILTECAAKRQIIDFAFEHAEMRDGEWGCGHTADQIKAGRCKGGLSDAVRLLWVLAQPYADRFGFDPEWSP